MSTQEIIEELPRLSREERERVAQALQDLAVKHQPGWPRPAGRMRKAGLHEGAWHYIADDFDAPLPDSFWLGNGI